MDDFHPLIERINGLEAKLRNTFMQIDQRLGELETRINHLENRLDELSRKGLSGNDEIAEMGHELKDIRTGDSGDVEKRLAALEEKIASADSSGSVMPEDFGRRIRELEEKIRSLGETRRG